MEIKKATLAGSAPATVVIVHMQEMFFASSTPSVLSAVCALVQMAGDEGWPVVVLEDEDDRGGTHGVIMDAIARAMVEVRLRRTAGTDCSYAVEKTCLRLGFPTGRFLIGGVNLCSCVIDTAEGLAARLPGCAIEIVSPACACACGQESCTDTLGAESQQIALVVPEEMKIDG